MTRYTFKLTSCTQISANASISLDEMIKAREPQEQRKCPRDLL